MHCLSLYLFLLSGISAVLAAPAEELDFDDAKSFCKRNHGRVPILDTREDLDVVRAKALSIVGVAWWVLASDVGQEPGQFKWANGKELPLNSSLWFKQEDQPESFGPGKKTCVVFSTWFGRSLWDENCEDAKYVVCQANDGC